MNPTTTITTAVKILYDKTTETKLHTSTNVLIKQRLAMISSLWQVGLLLHWHRHNHRGDRSQDFLNISANIILLLNRLDQVTFILVDMHTFLCTNPAGIVPGFP